MKISLLILTVGLVVSVKGWGAVFNRPQALVPEEQKTGSYYNHYMDSKHNVELGEPRVLARKIENMMSNELKELEDDPCYEKKCTSNENCCDGSVCIDMEPTSVGTCMPLYGKRQGERCVRSSDCETGFMCLEGERGMMMCQELVPGTGRFGDDCTDSDDCNIHMGLCCRLQRRQRMQPKKLCTYFTTPDSCLGPVAHHMVRRTIEYTDNEKRKSSHPDHQELYPGF